MIKEDKMKIVVLISGAIMGLALPAFGMVFDKPTEGQNIVVGETFDVWIRPLPGETCERIETADMPPIPFNPATGRFEGKVTLNREHPLGKTNFFAPGEPAIECQDAAMKINVVLPTTTVLQGIRVEEQDLFLTKVPVGTRGAHFYETEQLRVEGQYSDSVERDISSSMGTTYTSSDEKVATVDAEGLVTAHAPGTARITIKNGKHELTVEALVKEKKEKP
jgi:hypothetical protein